MATNTLLTVFTTHLKAKKPFANVRALQAEQLASFTSFIENAVIIAGDFNADPQEEAIITMKKSFSSAYEKLLGSEPVFTTYKYRKPTELQARTIDYVFFNNKVESVCGWLDIPEEKTIPVIGNPNENHPSDHYAIAFEFKITSS